MREKCWMCKGRGYLYKIDPLLTVFTFGITALIDLSFAERNTCNVCYGKGYLID